MALTFVVMPRILQICFYITFVEKIIFCSAQDVQTSQFPRGPFALPMSKDGCPEGTSRGWKTGYVNITTVLPFDEPHSYLPACREVVKSYNFNHTDTAVIGPFGQYTLQLNFCFKSGEHALNTNKRWVQGYYGLFGTDEGCPQGFSAHNMSICLPPLLHYNIDGHIPYLQLVEIQEYAELQFIYCRRMQTLNDNNTHTINAFRPFMVIKDPEGTTKTCPDEDGFYVSQEHIPIPLPTRFTNMSDESTAYFQMSFCHFTHAIYDETEYSFWQSVMTWHGYPGFGYFFVGASIITDQCGNYAIGPSTNCKTWIMFDAGKTVLVSGILFSKMDTILQGQLRNVFVGNDRWSFLYDGAFLCSYTVKETYDPVIIPCHRSVFGRYVALVFESTADWDANRLQIFKGTLISILSYEHDRLKRMELQKESWWPSGVWDFVIDTMLDLYYSSFDSQSCNQELGMRHYDILDQQLTSSSWQQSNSPAEARPHLSGWCVEYSDIKPYIQVDFIFVTSIDGVVITNWFEIVKNRTNNTYQLAVERRGSYSFYIEYGTTLSLLKRYNEKDFVIDESRYIGEPQSFSFSDQFVARYLRIFPSAFQNTDVPCMKFEILGCRMTENTGVVPNIRIAGYRSRRHVSLDAPVNYLTTFGLAVDLQYPTNAYSTAHTWNIQLPQRHALVQFTLISLPVFQSGEEDIFLNDRICEDVIIFSKVRTDLISALTDKSSDVFRLDSNDNGRLPAFVMQDPVAFLMFIACPSGNLVKQGRGFKVRIIKSDHPFCQGTNKVVSYCSMQTMDIVSNTFLRQSIHIHEDYTYAWVIGWPVETTKDSLVLTIQFEDFDISCSSESSFSISSHYTTEYKGICNSNRPHGKIYFISGPTEVFYKPDRSNTFRLSPFQEGFKFKYNILPKESTISFQPEKLEYKTDEWNNLTVCVDEFNKCYHLRSGDSTSWYAASELCKYYGLLLLNLKSKKEQQLLRGLLLDFYRQVAIQNNMLYSANPAVGYTLLGLSITPKGYIGAETFHMSWSDGTPLTYTAWDLNEPAKISIDRRHAAMRLFPLENENPWKTVSINEELPGISVYACEETIGLTNKGGRIMLTDVYETTLSDYHTVFKCGSGEFISNLALCNGMNECSDASDETNCTLRTGDDCKENEFRCTNGRCIHVSKVCDFKEDCLYAEDEYCDLRECNPLSEFTCFNRQCIPLSKRCNTEEDCRDGSDETDCNECVGEAFRCGDRSCIPKRLLCDRIYDCVDGSDEISCEEPYSTCEDLWKGGFTASKIYLIGEDQQYVYCDFDNVNSSKSIKMTYLNSDWTQRTETEFQITTPGVEAALNSGYACKQKFTELPHRERIRSLKLENQSYEIQEWEYWLDSELLDSLAHTSFKVKHNIKDGRHTSFSLRTTDLFKHSENRINIGPVVCDKEIQDLYNTYRDRIFCQIGIKTADGSRECLYELDSNRQIIGCRSLTHLQNCENFTCPEHHFKCPLSYCIPFMYVCDGHNDCGDGSDEQYCGCSNTERRNIVFIYQPVYGTFYPSYVRIAAGLGAVLYTENSTIKVCVRMDIDNKPIIYCFDVYLNSEYVSTSYLFTSTLDFFRDKEEETNAIIWMSDSKDDNVENKEFERTGKLVENIQRYKVEIDKKLKTDFAVTVDASNITFIKVRQKELLGPLASTLFPGICRASPMPCYGMYRCIMSKVCIPLAQVCDGRKHCPFNDDEEHCDINCPNSCTCDVATIHCRGVDSVVDIKITPSIRVIDVSDTYNISWTVLKNETDIFNVRVLNLSMCHLENIAPSTFDSFANLLSLDLSYNLLEILYRDTFSKLVLLEQLHLRGNRRLHRVEPGAFRGLSIASLSISEANIQQLEKNTFPGLHLTSLDVSNCKIHSIQDLAFNGLYSLVINIDHNPIKTFSKGLFKGVEGVTHIQTPAYKFCCVRPEYLIEENCRPYQDEFSSCKDIMRRTELRVLLWVIGLLALLGNVFSLMYRLLFDKKRLNLGYGIFVTNLAVADLFMGIYMLTIAVADSLFRDRYIEVDEYWRHSIWCALAGILSTTSSEASILFMCLITIDRILVIKYPFGQYRFSTRSALLSVIVCWILSLSIALLPVVYSNYFQGSFYSKSAVCLALPLTRDRPPGWLYSIFIFIGLNLVTFILIAVGQLLIYTEIKKFSSVKKSMNVSRTDDLKVARNLLLVVTSDFLCWFPVGIMAVFALTGRIIPSEIYAWTAVLILPVNSALNPFLYTLSAILGKAHFNPDIEEQTRSESAKEVVKTMLSIHPYIELGKGIYNKKLCSLDILQQNRKLTATTFIRIIYYVFKFEELLHENDLVVKKITEEDILVQKSGNIGKKIRILSKLVMSENTTDRKDDIAMIGNIIKRSLRCLRYSK